VNPLSEYRRQGRGGLGLRAFKLTKNTGLIADAQIVAESTEVYVVSEKAQIMRTSLSEIKTLRGRITQGVTIFKPRPGDSVSSIACVSEVQLEEESGKEGTEKDSSNAKKKPNWLLQDFLPLDFFLALEESFSVPSLPDSSSN
jgi:hypothetical protein